MKYRKTALVDAEQFLPAEGKIPAGVRSSGFSDPGKSPEEWVLDTLEGQHTLRNGDYICTGPGGERWNVEQSIFEATYEPALPPASPARTPMGGPQVLKGVGKINGDGWKDTTTIGEVVYVWNAEKPSPYAPGQYPRIGNEGWSASTAQYDFSPASVDEVRALAAPTPMGGDREHSSRCWGRTSFSDEVLHCYCQTAPTPMGGEVEALRGALERIAKRPFQKEREGRRERCPSCAYAWDLDDDRHKERHAESCDRIVATQALAASSPSPAQGGIDYSTLADLHTIKGWLHGLSTHPDLEDVVADGGVTAGMGYQQEAREFAGRIGRIIAALSASPQPEAGEASEDDRAQAWLLRHYRQKAEQAGFGSLAEMMHAAAPPSVQPVEGK